MRKAGAAGRAEGLLRADGRVLEAPALGFDEAIAVRAEGAAAGCLLAGGCLNESGWRLGAGLLAGGGAVVGRGGCDFEPIAVLSLIHI